MSEISESEIKSMTKEQNYMRGYSDGKQDILDQIRAEIKQLPLYGAKFLNGYFTVHVDVDEVLQIIDKYRGEGL